MLHTKDVLQWLLFVQRRTRDKGPTTPKRKQENAKDEKGEGRCRDKGKKCVQADPKDSFKRKIQLTTHVAKHRMQTLDSQPMLQSGRETKPRGQEALKRKTLDITTIQSGRET